MVNLKRPITLQQLGLTAGSVVSILAVLTIVLPLLRSDVPPFAGIARAEGIEAKANSLQIKIDATYKSMLFLQEGFWTDKLINAQEELRKNPQSTAAQRQLLNAQQQLDRLRAEMNK